MNSSVLHLFENRKHSRSRINVDRGNVKQVLVRRSVNINEINNIVIVDVSLPQTFFEFNAYKNLPRFHKVFLTTSS